MRRLVAGKGRMRGEISEMSLDDEGDELQQNVKGENGGMKRP
jgi:hypothetical protein